MYSAWLHKNNRDNCLLFCNGWGMDGMPFNHLTSDAFDVLMLHDYSLLPSTFDIRPMAQKYRHIVLVCWSMGVWVGQKLFYRQEGVFQRTIAVNGTLCPMHDRFGIPEAVFEGTLLNYDEAGRKKFYHRMCREKLIYKHFIKNQPERSVENQRAELAALKDMVDCIPPEKSIFQQVLIADHDLVVPTANQQQYWQENKTVSTLLPGVHFPFTSWKSWDDFLAYTDSVYLS